MAKFAIECPKCGTVNTASNFLFAKKVIECGACHSEINVKTSRLISKKCPFCENTFVYDQANVKNRRCPSCGKPIDAINAATVRYSMTAVNCPQCACAIEVDKTKPTYFCPICDCQIDVQKELHKAKLANETGVSVIQYEGDNSTFVWKHPIEDFNLGSQLIVHESQEAIFFLNGEALDTFGPGRHTLETENLPVLKKFYSLPTGKQVPFHAEVYFVNQTVQMALKWGTDSHVRFIDPETQIPLNIGASGEINLQVCDSRKLLIKLVGTTGGLSSKHLLSATSDSSGAVHKSLQSYFRAPLMTEVKSHLASAIKEQQINILEIDNHLSELSAALRARVCPIFEEYGLTVPEFYVTTVLLPEDSAEFQEIKKIRSRAYLDVKNELIDAQLRQIRSKSEADAALTAGLAEAEVMRAQGYNKKDLIDAEIHKAYAEGVGKMGENGGGSGGMAADLVGMMAQMKMAGTMFDKMNDLTPNARTAQSPQTDAATWTCACGESGNTKNFCMNCGQPKPETWTCSACGHSENKGKFCEECGAPKAPALWTCPACGESGNKGKFCTGCGAKKPE